MLMILILTDVSDACPAQVHSQGLGVRRLNRGSRSRQAGHSGSTYQSELMTATNAVRLTRQYY